MCGRLGQSRLLGTEDELDAEKAGMQAAERTITQDLENLIHKAVDSKTADYAVVTGIQARPCLAACRQV